MAYSALGCVICKEDEDWNVIEVVMHDSRTQLRRIPQLNDLYRFSMAALGDKVRSCQCRPFPTLPMDNAITLASEANQHQGRCLLWQRMIAP